MLIRIPIRLHLLKYLKYKIGGDKLEIKQINQLELFQQDGDLARIQRELSKSLFPFINTNYQWEFSQLGKQNKYALVGLEFKDYLVSQKRLKVSINGVLEFNRVLDQLMLEELLSNLDSSISKKTRHDTAILDFMNKCQIDEDDIRFDSLKKRCYRERLKIAEKIFLDKNIPRTGVVLDLSFGENFIQS